MIDILEDLRKIFLTGIGAAAMTYDKAIEVVDSLVQKGRLSVEEGRVLSEELKRDVKIKAENVKSKANEKFEEIKPITKEDMQDIFKELDFATKEEVNELKNRITELENKLQNKE